MDFTFPQSQRCGILYTMFMVYESKLFRNKRLTYYQLQCYEQADNKKPTEGIFLPDWLYLVRSYSRND